MNREEMLRKRVEGRTGTNTDEKEALTKERIQEAKNSNTGLEKLVKENPQNSTSSQGFKSVDVRENVQGSSASQPKTVDVRENVQSSTSSQGFKTVDVRENVQKDSGEMKEKTQKINIVEDRKSAKKFDSNHETVIIDSEIRENDKGSKPRRRFTYEDNELFRDTFNDPNPLFDSLLKK